MLATSLLAGRTGQINGVPSRCRSCSSSSVAPYAPPVVNTKRAACSDEWDRTSGAVLALGASYRRDRLLSFVDPFAHAGGTGYQVVQGLVTLGQGGLKGDGVGASVTTWGYLPNGHTDFIFAVIGGNLGILGTVGVLAGFAAFGWAGFRIARREKDPFTRFLAIGITCWIIAQAVINIGGVVDVLPVTGIPLPFISYGGSALVVAMAGAGILLGIARRQVAVPAVGARRARSAISGKS